MQFSIATDALADALGWVSKSLPARPSAPVLAGVRITVVDGALTLAAFDYEQSATATLDTTTSSNGEVVVSGRLFAEIVRALPKGEVQVSEDGNRLIVQARTSKFSLAIMPVEEYPTLPQHPTIRGSVDAAVFAQAVKQVVLAAGRDDSLPVLTSVFVNADPDTGTLTFAATDRFRLAVKKVDFTAADGAEAISVLIPARTLDLWAKSLGGKEGDRLTFGAEDGSQGSGVFSLHTATRSATVRLYDGQYPNFNSLIPADFSAETTVSTSQMAEAIKRVALVAEKSTPITLEFTDGVVSISVAGDSEAFEQVETEHAGGEITMGFNIAYLGDAMTALGGETARVSLVAASKPAVFRPAKEDENYIYLLMPMRGAGR